MIIKYSQESYGNANLITQNISEKVNFLILCNTLQETFL